MNFIFDGEQDRDEEAVASAGAGAAAAAASVVDKNKNNKNLIVVSNLDDSYPGRTIEEQVERLLQQESVVVFGRTWCPFSNDVVQFLSQQMCVVTHLVQVNQVQPQGELVRKYIQEKTHHRTIPVIFVKNKYLGGADELNAAYQRGDLENETLRGLMQRKRALNTEQVETAQLAPPVTRSKACMPKLWFPPVVNNHVARVTALLVFALAAVCAIFLDEQWTPYLALAICIDFWLRFCCGSFLSPIGMLATLFTLCFQPNFKPGAPIQLACLIGILVSLVATICYFFKQTIVGAVFMGLLAIAAGAKGFFDYCFACKVFGFGIRIGIFRDYVYHVYNSSRQEYIDTWNYRYLNNSHAPKPVRVDTDPHNPIALRYKKKTDEWTKDDFDPIRHMQISYFICPMSIAGLALSFKLATDFKDIRQVKNPAYKQRETIVQDGWYQVFAGIAAFIFVFMLFLYLARCLLFPRKVRKEWQSPLLSPNFGAISISFMLFSFLCYDELVNIDDDDDSSTSPGSSTPAQVLGRVLWWVGSVVHALLNIAKMGEWIGRRLEIEHVHPHWMILPIGLGVAAFCAPVVAPFEPGDEKAVGNTMIARFYYSFGWFMSFTLFVITFFKVVTQHNTDNRLRHGVWFWLAAPCVFGAADYTICRGDKIPASTCAPGFANLYFIGIFMFLSLLWAGVPHFAFFGRDSFNMGYWIECFALAELATCSTLFYLINGWEVSQVLEFIALAIATIVNIVALLHTVVSVCRKHGVGTPEMKLGPLSFCKLTHDAIRANLPTLKHYLQAIDLDDHSDEAKDNLGLFAAHFNRFRIIYEEHSRHEDQVIFKAFNDLFPGHARKYNEDHAEDYESLAGWCFLANKVLDEDVTLREKKLVLERLRGELPSFFTHVSRHMHGEEDNLWPIAKKYLPLELSKQVSRDVWNITPADRWEIILPFVVMNLPRHTQRIAYLKVLCWSMPERAQQFGAIVYRNVDAVMWERLRVELPEIIPRELPNWRRYY